MVEKCDICGDMTIKMHKTEDGVICHKCFCSAEFNLGVEVSGKTTADLKSMRIVDAEKAVKCARCGSVSISANEKGFGVGKAVVDVALTGLIGLATGGMRPKRCLSSA